MTKQRDLKCLVRDRQALTGESYMTALRHVRGQRPSSVPVIELVDASDIGAALGIKCGVMMMPALARRVEVTAMLRQLCRVLLASTRDRAFSLMRSVVLCGERPFAPLGTFEEGLRFHRRTSAGIGGISESGRMLSFAIPGRRAAELAVFLAVAAAPAPRCPAVADRPAGRRLARRPGARLGRAAVRRADEGVRAGLRRRRSASCASGSGGRDRTSPGTSVSRRPRCRAGRASKTRRRWGERPSACSVCRWRTVSRPSSTRCHGSPSSMTATKRHRA